MDCKCGVSDNGCHPWVLTCHSWIGILMGYHLPGLSSPQVFVILFLDIGSFMEIVVCFLGCHLYGFSYNSRWILMCHSSVEWLSFLGINLPFLNTGISSLGIQLLKHCKDWIMSCLKNGYTFSLKLFKHGKDVVPCSATKTKQSIRNQYFGYNYAINHKLLA